jgi:hypothetical protein
MIDNQITIEVPDDWPPAAKRQFVQDLIAFINDWEQPPADLHLIDEA